MRKQPGKQITGTGNKSPSGDLIGDIRSLIEAARQNVAATVNAGLTLLYWQIGSRIRQDILEEKRARYGEDLLPTLSAKLVREFGRGFTEKNLRRMVQFAEAFSDMEIVVTLSRQLSWSHFAAKRQSPARFLRRNVSGGTLECSDIEEKNRWNAL